MVRTLAYSRAVGPEPLFNPAAIFMVRLWEATESL